MNEDHERFRRDDAAYVLGALDADEEQAFEEHLDRCAACRRSVAALSRLPDALARVPEDLLAEDEEPSGADQIPALPSGMLDDVLQRAQATRSAAARHRWMRDAMVASVSAIVAAAVVLALALLPRQGASVSDAPRPDTTVALTPVSTDPMAVDVALTTVPWGTRIAITCQYPETWGSGGAQAASYSLVVSDANGGQERVATWRAVPGSRVTVDAATALPLTSIRGLEVRTQAGSAVLRGHV